MTFTVPIRTKNPTNGSRGASMGAVMADAKRRRWERTATEVAWQCAIIGGSAPRLPVVVTLTRVAPSEGLDDDALPASLKSVRDALAVLLGLPARKVRGKVRHAEDRDPRVRWRYAQERGRPREYAVRVEVVPAGDALGVVEAWEGGQPSRAADVEATGAREKHDPGTHRVLSIRQACEGTK